MARSKGDRAAHVALVRRRLRERLVAAATAVGSDVHIDVVDDSEAASRIVLDLVTRAAETTEPAVIWLAWVAIATTYPSPADIQELLSPAVDETALVADQLVARGIRAGERFGDLTLGIVVATSSIVVDASYSATNDHNSGIQRVVRSASRVWSEEEDVVLATSTGPSGALRTLTGAEFDRTARWGDDGSDATAEVVAEPVLVVPWRSSVVFPEVPDPQRIDGLIGLARFSGNATFAIGHDAIPITGREYVSGRETSKFSHFLALLAELGTVIAVSETAAADFRGLGASFQARGGRSALVVPVPLPVMVDAQRQRESPNGDPLVLVVGSKEPRKNQDAVVFAAETLWREGLQFELHLLGSFGWSTSRFRKWLAVARRGRRAISAPRASSDQQIWAAYDRASFTVFPSFQEGFGLPVAESLSRGVPVITSDYGSMAELALGGGCLTVDPYDADALVVAMRDLLRSPDRLAELREEIARRPADSWARYASSVLQVVRRGR